MVNVLEKVKPTVSALTVGLLGTINLAQASFANTISPGEPTNLNAHRRITNGTFEDLKAKFGKETQLCFPLKQEGGETRYAWATYEPDKNIISFRYPQSDVERQLFVTVTSEGISGYEYYYSDRDGRRTQMVNHYIDSYQQRQLERLARELILAEPLKVTKKDYENLKGLLGDTDRVTMNDTYVSFTIQLDKATENIVFLKPYHDRTEGRVQNELRFVLNKDGSLLEATERDWYGDTTKLSNSMAKVRLDGYYVDYRKYFVKENANPEEQNGAHRITYSTAALQVVRLQPENPDDSRKLRLQNPYKFKEIQESDYAKLRELLGKNGEPNFFIFKRTKRAYFLKLNKNDNSIELTKLGKFRVGLDLDREKCTITISRNGGIISAKQGANSDLTLSDNLAIKAVHQFLLEIEDKKRFK